MSQFAHKSMDAIFSDRIHDVPRSFIREILKASLDAEMISFAGGLPNRKFFPVDELREATERVFEIHGTSCLQYSNSEGLIELRRYISERYKQKQGINIDPDHILITNGSQQALDLIAKVMINDGDQVIIEEPGYLGAIQALSLYKPRYLPVKVSDHGMDIEALETCLKQNQPKLMYTVPNFQNPAGISYSNENRAELARVVNTKHLLVIEDDPYGDLRFRGERLTSFYEMIPEHTILLGSFSKTVVPGFRLGWVAAPDRIMEKLLIAKQASDLHTSNFTQYIIYEFLKSIELDHHIELITKAYGNQCRAMLEAIDEFFPKEVVCTRPDGGMFLWGKLPEGARSMNLFERAIDKKVIFVPGEPFYTVEKESSSFRLNFSCVEEELGREGIYRLAGAINEIL